MGARAAIVAGLLAAAVPLDSPAQAQLSPQGIVGGVTRPLRQMLGNFGHFPRSLPAPLVERSAGRCARTRP